MFDVEPVAEVGGINPNPNENLGGLSAGLGGSEVEAVLVVVGTGTGVFVTWGPILATSDGALMADVGVTVD